MHYGRHLSANLLLDLCRPFLSIDNRAEIADESQLVFQRMNVLELRAVHRRHIDVRTALLPEVAAPDAVALPREVEEPADDQIGLQRQHRFHIGHLLEPQGDRFIS